MLKVQRNLPAPVVCVAECELRAKVVQTAPVLSRALTRVLNATESKENKVEEDHSDNDMAESTKDTKPSGKFFTITDTSYIRRDVKSCNEYQWWGKASQNFILSVITKILVCFILQNLYFPQAGDTKCEIIVTFNRFILHIK